MICNLGTIKRAAHRQSIDGAAIHVWVCKCDMCVIERLGGTVCVFQHPFSLIHLGI
jgi:hypothetical protein